MKIPELLAFCWAMNTSGERIILPLRRRYVHSCNFANFQLKEHPPHLEDVHRPAIDSGWLLGQQD